MCRINQAQFLFQKFICHYSDFKLFVFSGVDKFQHTCAVGEYTDDLTVGAIIGDIIHCCRMYY